MLSYLQLYLYKRLKLPFCLYSEPVWTFKHTFDLGLTTLSNGLEIILLQVLLLLCRAEDLAPEW